MVRFCQKLDVNLNLSITLNPGARGASMMFKVKCVLVKLASVLQHLLSKCASCAHYAGTWDCQPPKAPNLMGDPTAKNFFNLEFVDQFA